MAPAGKHVIVCLYKLLAVQQTITMRNCDCGLGWPACIRAGRDPATAGTGPDFWQFCLNTNRGRPGLSLNPYRDQPDG